MFVIDFEMYGMVEYGVKKVDEPQVKGTLFFYFMNKIEFFCDDKCFIWFNREPSFAYLILMILFDIVKIKI